MLRLLHFLQDTGREIDLLCSFLGLSLSAEEKERVTTGVKFDNMKQNKMTNYSTYPSMDHKVSPFIRKGTVNNVYWERSSLLRCFLFAPKSAQTICH